MKHTLHGSAVAFGPVLFLASALPAYAGSAPFSADPDCWHRVKGDPTRYELLIKLNSALHSKRVGEILAGAGVEDCHDLRAANEVCLATYKRKSAKDTPDKKSLKLMKKKDHGQSVFAYVVPNAPVKLVMEGEGESGARAMRSRANSCAASSPYTVPYPSPILTAVIDTGVDLTHPGLQANMIPGADFSCGRLVCNALPADTTGGHGTNMTGIIDAHDDGQGVCGNAWNTHFIPLRAFVDVESTDGAVGNALAAAIKAETHASVINASWTSQCLLPHTEEEIALAQDAGILFVTAAGNDSVNIDLDSHKTYPAEYGRGAAKNMIVVMGHYTDPIKAMPLSSWGAKTVDLAAPARAYTAQPCSEGGACYGTTGYSTSMATAYVSGAAALLKSLHTDWSAEQIKKQLMESAQPEKWLIDKNRAGGRVVLDRAVNGPLVVESPGARHSWSRGEPHTVTWSNSYRSSLCKSVTVSARVNGGASVMLAANADNNGQTTVRLDGLADGTHAVMTVTCLPGKLSADSAPFVIRTPSR